MGRGGVYIVFSLWRLASGAVVAESFWVGSSCDSGGEEKNQSKDWPPRTAGATQARGHEEEVGRVGEDEVDRGFGNECEEFEGIALIEMRVVLGVVEGEMVFEQGEGGGRMGGGFGHARG
jgi:hypothetical protein